MARDVVMVNDGVGSSSGSPLAIGYNVQQVNQVMVATEAAAYDACKYVGDNFPALRTTLRQEWIGPDEVDFENKLVVRLNDLLGRTTSLSMAARDTVYNLAYNWIQFQENNVLEIDGISTTAESNLTGKLETVPIRHPEQLIQEPLTFDGSENLGLASASSFTKLHAALESYVKGIQGKTTSLFNSIETSSAFFGDQTTHIKKYIESVGFAISELQTAIKEFDIAMESLTDTSYGQANETVTTEFSESNIDTRVNEAIGELGSSRWSSES